MQVPTATGPTGVESKTEVAAGRRQYGDDDPTVKKYFQYIADNDYDDPDIESHADNGAPRGQRPIIIDEMGAFEEAQALWNYYVAIGAISCTSYGRNNCVSTSNNYPVRLQSSDPTAGEVILDSIPGVAAAASGGRGLGAGQGLEVPPVQGPGPGGGESSAAAFGRATHAAYNYGQNFVPEYTLANGKRVDAVNFKTREVVELKPNNPRAIREGENQARDYAAQLGVEEPGRPFTYRVVTYDQP